MTESSGGAGNDGGTDFGACCNELKEALAGEEFEPLLTVGDDGVLYMSVGIVDLGEGDEEGPGFVDHPLFFCPFCGTGLQSREDVAARMQQNGADGEDDEGKA
jgi:hypothetical protein